MTHQTKQSPSERSKQAESDTRRLPRVGVLVPSTDTTLEQELSRLLDGVASVHVTRMALGDVDEASLLAMETDALRAAALLADVDPDVVLYGCTSGTFILGAEHERSLASRLAEITGAGIVTTAWALLKTLPEHGRRIRLRTPYTDDLTSAEARYLTEAGFTVVSTAGLGIARDPEIAKVEAGTVLDLALPVPPASTVSSVRDSDDVCDTVIDDGAEAVLLSCTNLPTLDHLDDLQTVTGLPVVSSNLAAVATIRRVLAGDLAPLASHVRKK